LDCMRCMDLKGIGMARLALMLVAAVWLAGCGPQTGQTPAPPLATGIWGGEIRQYDDVIPFNFEVVRDGEALQVFYLNGPERMPVEEIVYDGGADVAFNFPSYVGGLTGRIEDGTMTGEVTLTRADKVHHMPFEARSGKTHRFFETSPEAYIDALARDVEALSPIPEPCKTPHDLNGRWRMLYSSFGLEQETTLRRLSFSRLPRLPIKIISISQEVNAGTGAYDNVLHGTTSSGLEIVHVVEGRFEPDAEHMQRLQIAFTSTYVYPVDESLSVAEFREALGADEEDVLAAGLMTQGLYSDVTYLDDDFRLNRGNIGNLYVIAKETAHTATSRRASVLGEIDTASAAPAPAPQEG
ncbi:MAG: PAP/fibrillin family protein, partial [Pseudomonadota bacterium]